MAILCLLVAASGQKMAAVLTVGMTANLPLAPQRYSDDGRSRQGEHRQSHVREHPKTLPPNFPLRFPCRQPHHFLPHTGNPTRRVFRSDDGDNNSPAFSGGLGFPGAA